MRRPALLCLFGLGGLSLQDPSPPQSPSGHAQAPSEAPGRPGEAAAAARVSDRVARDTVRALVALGPRMGGTPSGVAAAEYLRDAFAAAGLAAEVVEDGERWCHHEAAWSLVARTAGEEPLTLERAWPWGFSPSASGRARLVLDQVGEPGQAVLQSSHRRARRGAAQYSLALVDGVTTGDGSFPAVRAIRRGSRAPVFGLSRGEGARLREWLAAGREVTLDYDLEATIERARPRTTIARLPARRGAPPGYLLYCAHGDSDAGGPGANDNASGEAVVLEIARAWAEAVQAGEVPAPAREVRFAVWGSEIASSRYFLEQRAAEDGPILGVINYDQAGFGSGAEQLNVEPDDLPANVAMVHTVLGVLADFGGRAGFPERWATNKSLGGTDSYVFSGSRQFREGGLPAVTLFTSAWGSPGEHPRTEGMPGESWRERDLVRVDYDNYYHSAGDTPENTTDKEPHNMGWCARVGLLAGMRYLEGLRVK